MLISNVLAAGVNMNSAGIYLMYAVIVVFVLAQSVFYLLRALKRAKELNIESSKIKKAITSSVSFSILPSVGIFIGIVTLIPILGIPMPAIRLSIIGALQYETMAANQVADNMGGMQAIIGNITPAQYVTIVSAMTFGIIWGPMFCLFALKKIAQKKNEKAPRKTTGKWKDYVFGSVFVGMVVAFFAVAIAKAASAPAKVESYYYIIAVIVATLSMWLFDVIIKKYNQQWLENFNLALSMIIGMGVVAVISYFNFSGAADAAGEASAIITLVQGGIVL